MNDANYKELIVEKKGGVAIVTINRPDARNAINRELHAELDHIWLVLQDDPSVQVIVLTGKGAAFSSGGDLKRLADRAGTDEGNRLALELPTHGRRLLNNILEVQKPIIAAINGDAIGLGATLALFCDITVMAKEGRIGDPHVRVGVSAGDGGSIIWPLLSGPSRAKDYLMRGLLATGDEAERINLVNYSVPANEVLPKAIKIAEELASLPPWAVKYTKATVNIAVRQHFNQAMDASLAYEALTMKTADHKEGAQAFLDKRKPKFTGR
jgi:enoyl-CoA hydratase/carnithine racemase